MDASPTDSSPTDSATFAPRPHPERRLVAAIVALSLVCVAVWWLGAVGPRLTAAVRSVEVDHGASAGRGTLRIEVRNHGLLPVDVRGVTVDERGGPPVGLGAARLDGSAEGGAVEVRLAGGERVQMEVPYTVDCDRPGGYGTDPALGVRVHAPIGVTQTRSVDIEGVTRALVGGDDSVDPGPLLCRTRRAG